MQIVVSDLDKAFRAFFRRKKAGETPGFPRFKGRNRFASFGFKEYGNGFKDHNAALNILKRAGQVRWGISSPLGGLPQEAAPF